jgi:cytochrome c553
MDHVGVRALLPLLTIWAVVAASCVEVAADDARLKAYGQHLSQQCTACHRADGVRVGGIPAIVGWPADQFVAVLKSYKSGERQNPVMISVTEPLGEEEMNALAAHFGALPKPAQPSGKPAKSR